MKHYFANANSLCVHRSPDQPHGDGDGDRRTHRVHTFHSAQCHLAYVFVAEAKLDVCVCLKQQHNNGAGLNATPVFQMYLGRLLMSFI